MREDLEKLLDELLEGVELGVSTETKVIDADSEVGKKILDALAGLINQDSSDCECFSCKVRRLLNEEVKQMISEKDERYEFTKKQLTEKSRVCMRLFRYRRCCCIPERWYISGHQSFGKSFHR